MHKDWDSSFVTFRAFLWRLRALWGCWTAGPNRCAVSWPTPPTPHGWPRLFVVFVEKKGNEGPSRPGRFRCRGHPRSHEARALARPNRFSTLSPIALPPPVQNLFTSFGIDDASRQDESPGCFDNKLLFWQPGGPATVNAANELATAAAPDGHSTGHWSRWWTEVQYLFSATCSSESDASRVLPISPILVCRTRIRRDRRVHLFCKSWRRTEWR
jgi:hypothetical protein